MNLAFQVTARDGYARRGRLATPHGVVETPAFLPVGTHGAVKGVPPQALEQAGASILLANLYHLAVRPGVEVIEGLGGLHAFSGWRRPLLTDSGGYQVRSLARLCAIDEAGATFRSHVDGSLVRFTPEGVVEQQRRLGVDVAMVLDECPSWPIEREAAAASLARTNRWARRSREAWPGGPGGLFGIVQGSVFLDLRERAVAELSGLDLDGYALGGISVGEPRGHRRRVVEAIGPSLPEDRPRYLMGVGTPEDLLDAVRCGLDLFDCVLPSRNARHGVLFTREGVLRIKNARFRTDPHPVDPACSCPACVRVSRAFLHHLLHSSELTGEVLATLHNLRFYLDFMADLREAIAAGTLGQLASRCGAGSAGGGPSETASTRSGSAASHPLS